MIKIKYKNLILKVALMATLTSLSGLSLAANAPIEKDYLSFKEKCIGDFNKKFKKNSYPDRAPVSDYCSGLYFFNKNDIFSIKEIPSNFEKPNFWPEFKFYSIYSYGENLFNLIEQFSKKYKPIEDLAERKTLYLNVIEKLRSTELKNHCVLQNNKSIYKMNIIYTETVFNIFNELYDIEINNSKKSTEFLSKTEQLTEFKNVSKIDTLHYNLLSSRVDLDDYMRYVFNVKEFDPNTEESTLKLIAYNYFMIKLLSDELNNYDKENLISKKYHLFFEENKYLEKCLEIEKDKK